MSVKFHFKFPDTAKIVAVYFLPYILYIVSSINLKVCCIRSRISGTNSFMIWRKLCQQNTRFCSWNGTNFNFGWGSAPDPATTPTTLQRSC